MTDLAAVGIWVLGLVFVWSGATKLRRPRLAAMAMVDFGVVRRPSAGLGLGLGAVEVGLGLLLLSGRTTTAALATATALLVLFSALLARSLAAGASFPCQCFGGEDKAISIGTLSRTGGLAAGAALLWLAVAAGADPGTAGPATRAVAAVGLISTVVLLRAVLEVLGWTRTLVGTFRILAEPGESPRPDGRTTLPLREATPS